MTLLIYLASRFSRIEELRGYRDELRAEGIEVTSRWLNGGHEWSGTPDDETPPAEAARFAIEDLEDIDAADVLVAFTEPPRTGPSRGGRHCELGYALGIGVDVLIVGHRENVFCCHPSVEFRPDWPAAKALILSHG